MSRIHRQGAFLVWLMLMAALMVACSASKRITEPPVARLSGLELQSNGQMVVDIMLTNLNPVALQANSARFQVVSEGVMWVNWEQSIDWQVPANARDGVRMTGPLVSPKVGQWLDEISQGQRDSLPYTLTLALGLSTEDAIETEHQGFLYRVPGQPGRFR